MMFREPSSDFRWFSVTMRFEGRGLALKHFVMFATPAEYPAGS